MVLKIHVFIFVQLPNSIVTPALSRYSWHGFLLQLGELDVIFSARLFSDRQHISRTKIVFAVETTTFIGTSSSLGKAGTLSFTLPWFVVTGGEGQVASFPFSASTNTALSRSCYLVNAANALASASTFMFRSNTWASSSRARLYSGLLLPPTAAAFWLFVSIHRPHCYFYC